MFCFHMKIKRLLECDNWVLRVFCYFSICATITAIPYIIFSKFNLLHTDVDSARYMLSALIQSEAAIIAIVVTMSLVAVQLAASSYSVRVVDIFRKKLDLWLLLLTYGFAIFWGLGVLKMIDVANPLACGLFFNCQSDHENYIIATYSLGVFVYVALGFYIWHMMGMLRPTAIIDTLAKDITKENICNEETIDENDPMLPIIDIINNSIQKYDHATSKTGLRAIEKRICAILNNKNYNADEKLKISEYTFEHLMQVGKLALSRSDETSTNQIINTIQNIGIIAVKNHCEQIANSAIKYLTNIGLSATTQKFELSARMAIKAIEKISVDNEIHIPTIAAGMGISCLGEIGMVAIDNRLERATSTVASSLGIIGQNAAENNQSVSHVIE